MCQYLEDLPNSGAVTVRKNKHNDVKSCMGERSTQSAMQTRGFNVTVWKFSDRVSNSDCKKPLRNDRLWVWVQHRSSSLRAPPCPSTSPLNPSSKMTQHNRLNREAVPVKQCPAVCGPDVKGIHNHAKKTKQNPKKGLPLVVQWLRLCAPNAGGTGSIPVQGTRSHMLQLKILHAAMKTQHSQINISKTNKHTKQPHSSC